MKSETQAVKVQKNGKDTWIHILCLVLITAFCFVIFSVGIVIAAKKDNDISESENRVLEKRPKLTVASLLNGSFMNDCESWLSDQFPLRGDIITFKTFVDRLGGKIEENGVYIGKNGFLFEKQTEYDEAQVKKITDAVNSFSKKYPELDKAVVISPNSSFVLSEYMPARVAQVSQGQQLGDVKEKLKTENIKWIDCVSVFEKAKDKTTLFYRTDHHWTTDAAYLIFKKLMKDWKIDISKDKFKMSVVTSDFQGTLASSAAVKTSFDTIKICTAQKECAYIVYYEAEGRKTATLFDSEKLEHKNQYEVFLGGNYDKVIISTDVLTDRTLLLFKDSYANCMISMLTPYFSKIVVIDPRYFSDDLNEVMKEYSFTHTLFLYNLNTFLEDTSLARVTEG